MRKRRAELGLAEAAFLFAAFGDEIRLTLLRRLSLKGPASISTLAGNFGITRQAVTKHLQFLAEAGVIGGTRRGREHVWTLQPDRIAEAQSCLERIGRGWDDVLARLKAHVERG